MKKMIQWVLVATLTCGASVFTACSSNDDNPVTPDLNLSEKIIGKWLVSNMNGKPLTTNDKSVYTFVSPTKAYISSSITSHPDLGDFWNDEFEGDVTINGNKMTLIFHPEEHMTLVETYNFTDFSDTEFTASHNVYVTIDGNVIKDDTHTIRFTKLNRDYSQAVLGLWECTGLTGIETYNDANARLEFLADGTYRYYRKDEGGQWQAVTTREFQDYFVDGTLLATRWKNQGQEELREWWEIASLADGQMQWTALRQNADGSTAQQGMTWKKIDLNLSEKIIGKWIHTDTDGETVTTDMKSVYTFEKNGDALKGYYSMSMTESGVWAYNQETDVTLNGNNVTLTSQLADGVTSVVELSDVIVSGDDLRFTAKTTLSKNGQVTATYGPRQEHFTKTEADYTETVIGLWDIYFTSDDPEHESSEPYRELYRADGTCSFYDLIDGQWVEEKTDYSEYFADGPLFCFRWQKSDAGIDRRENWEIVSYENGKMVSKALHRRADGSTYTITAHLKKVE